MLTEYVAQDVRDTVKNAYGKTSEFRSYGHHCVLKYAQKNSANAMKNADKYALLALAAYYGIDSFQTDSDKLALPLRDELHRENERRTQCRATVTLSL